MSEPTPTLEVPADIYDEALAFCNVRLAEQDKPAITELPAGKRIDGFSCPCGKACGVYVSNTYWNHRGAPGTSYPNAPTRFVEFFDTYARGETTLPIRKEPAHV